MTIYMVNNPDGPPTYIDGVSNPNAKQEAENLLKQRQDAILVKEASRFSVCGTFVNGNDHVWRAIQDTDPEDTLCQVFNTFTGTHTQYTNKTEAYAANELLKQQFLEHCGLTLVYELDKLPKPPAPYIDLSDPLQTTKL